MGYYVKINQIYSIYGKKKTVGKLDLLYIVSKAINTNVIIFI